MPNDFLPEHEYEIAFRGGERIVVIEKDEPYSDGWWQVRSLSSSLRRADCSPFSPRSNFASLPSYAASLTSLHFLTNSRGVADGAWPDMIPHLLMTP